MRICLVSNGFGKKRLTRAGRSVEQDSFWRVNPDPQEQFRAFQRKLNCLFYLVDLGIETPDILVSFLRGIHQLHPVDLCIEPHREELDNRQ